MPQLRETRAAVRNKWRHLALLISILILFLISPFVVTDRWGVVVLNIASAAMLFSGTYALSERRAQFVVAIVLAVVSVMTNLVLILQAKEWLVLVAYCSVLLLLSLFSGAILGNVLRAERVTADKIFGAICVYLLVGYGWAFAYGIMEVLQPGSFTGLTEIGVVEHVSRIMELRYFSFVTLTTVGYGDIMPRSPVARTFTTIEAVMGQIYLAVLVARLVGLHIVHAGQPKDEGHP